jgi:hypothetical protein
MRHEQFNYMERVVSKALSEDSLRYGNPQIDYIKDTLNGCDHEGIVDVEYFVSELENMRNSKRSSVYTMTNLLTEPQGRSGST